MAYNDFPVNIPGRLKSAAVGGVVADAEDIYDDVLGKSQHTINSETEGRLDGQDTKIDRKLAEIDTKYEDFEDRTDELFEQEKVDNRNALNEAVSSLRANDTIVVEDHTAVADPETNKIYREYGETSYADWQYQNSAWVKLAEYSHGVDDEPTAGSPNLLESGGTYGFIKGNTLEDKEHSITDNEVAGYLTDKNKSVVAKLMKNGAVEWLVENSKDIANSIRFESIEELLSYVSSEVPDSGNGVIKYLTDKDGTVIATINNVGNTEFKGGGGFDGEITTSQSISFDAVKVVTDSKGSVIGWINSNGKVHIEELDVKTITSESGIGIPDQILSVLGFVASGTDNYKFVNDRTYALFKSMAGEYVKDGVEIETVPTISIQDDDSIDYQLPESYIPGATESDQPIGYEKRGGFASLLFPILKSLNIKHAGEINGGRITCASVAEGHRIGLTPYQSASDEFDGHLNSCGKIIKGLIEKEGWEVICHSMTVREGWERNSYLVNGLNSEFAQSLLIDATYRGTDGYSTYTTTCYDTVTKKNYMVKPDFSGWDILPDKYIKQYLQLTKATDSPLVVNPSYSVRYQVRTWQERAVQAGLPWVTLLTAWGDSHSSWHCREDMKYVNTVFASGSTWKVNTVPYSVNPNRNPLGLSPSVNGIPPESAQFYNVYNAYDYKKYIKHIDNVKSTKGWSILRPHMYVGEFVNYYRTEFENLYGAESAECGPMCYKDDNYPQEWITPLNHDELIDMVGENVHDYWNNPPARLGISSWDEWYPCPGTSCALIYDILEYAISQGIYFSRSEDVLTKYGNLFALGYENVVVLQPDKYLLPQYVDNSYCRIGADGSFTYVSK